MISWKIRHSYSRLYSIASVERLDCWNAMPNVVFGPQMALALRLDPISQGPKKSRFPVPNPLPLAQVMDLDASKALRTGPYKS
jgi:hypothetical protein